jgi:biopolymer transport protein TolR
MQGRRRRGDRMSVNSEINVVSLIDVMMLLMIVFMIAAPMMQSGVDVDLAKAQGQPLESKGAVSVTIDDDGTIYIDRDPVTLAEFQGSIKAIADRKGPDGVYLRLARRATAEQMAPVLTVLSANGIQTGFVFEPVEARR